MAYIDEVVEKNKRYLTQAQVEALSAASRQYNVQNAAGRASAQASAREQYDTGYRGLQNMGLAGSVSGPATSGEVPRLKSRISAPFEDYNRRLRDVENQRLNALGGQFAQQTMEEEARIAAEREAAARRAAEAARQAALRQVQLSAAAVVSKVQTAVKQQTAVDAATKAQLDGMKRTVSIKQVAANALNLDGVKKTAQAQQQIAQEQMEIRAVAQLTGVKAAADSAAVKAANAAQERGAKLTSQLTGKDTSTKNEYRTMTPYERAEQTRLEREAETAKQTVSFFKKSPAESAQKALDQFNASLNGYNSEEDAKAYTAAQKKLDAYDEAIQAGSWVPEDDYQQAVAQRNAAKLKAEDPDMYALLVVSNSNISQAEKDKVAAAFIGKKFDKIDMDDAAQKFRAAQETVNRMEANLRGDKKTTEPGKGEQPAGGPSLEQVNDVIAMYESAMAAYEDTAGHGAPSDASREPINKANTALNALGFKSIHSAERYRDSLMNAETTQQEPGDPLAEQKEQYKHYKSILDIIDDPDATEQNRANARASLGVGGALTEEEARDFTAKYEAYDPIPEELKRAREDLSAAELRYKHPEAYRAFQVLQYKDILGDMSPNIVSEAVKIASDYKMEQMFKTPAMSDEEFEEEKKTIKGLRRAYNNWENMKIAGGEFAPEKILKDKYGLTPEEAKARIDRFDKERDARSESKYYAPGMLAQTEHNGEKPSQPVNQNESDNIYRAVNGMQAVYFPEPMEGKTENTSVAKYMTDEQRDAYNAIYENDGLDAANQYYHDIVPYLNIQRAQQDEEYYRKFADEHPFLASVASVGANMIWNIPAAAENLFTGIRGLFTDERPYYDINSNWSFRSARADVIRSEVSQNILNNMTRPEWANNVLNAAYQTGMSMADSAAAMLFAAKGADWAVYALFSSSAGMSSYKEALARGATQDQALTFGVLCGAAESFFEVASLEHLINMDYAGRGALIKNILSQAGVEGSEELFTGMANWLSDMYVMRDKSEYSKTVQKYLSQGESRNKAEWKALLDQAKDIGLEGIGGAVSGALFGVGGKVASEASYKKYGSQLRNSSETLKRYSDLANLMGPETQKALTEYNENPTDRNAGRLYFAVNQAINETLEANVKQATDQADETTRNQAIDRSTALAALVSGEQMNAATAQGIMEAMGTDVLSKMGYDTSSSQALADSYNSRLTDFDVQARPGEITPKLKTNREMREATDRMLKSLRPSEERVWKDPDLGYVVTDEGRRVKTFPGNMTSVSAEEQKSGNYAARTTAVSGDVTYQIAGMEAREGLSDAQKVSEIKKNLSREYKNKAEFYEKISKALPGISFIVHDTMGMADGFFDKATNSIHVSLSGNQSALRVTAHELTHLMKENALAAYGELRQAIIDEIGRSRFERMCQQKAEEYTRAGDPIDYNTKEGREKAEDETIAELCERMLNDSDWIEKFCAEHTAAARTLSDYILKIVNAIKAALKDMTNRDFGMSWSGIIQAQNTFEKWGAALNAALENVANGTTQQAETVEAAQADEAIPELFDDEETMRAERRNTELQKEIEAEMKRGPYPTGYSSQAVENVINKAIETIGSKDTFSDEDYQRLRARIGQSLPTVEAWLKDQEDEQKQEAANERVRQVAQEIVDAYRETEGKADSLERLQKDMPDVIGIGPQQMQDVISQYDKRGLFVLQGMIRKALGRNVTLVTQSNPKFDGAQKMDQLFIDLQEKYNLSDDQDFSRDAQNLVDFIQGVRDASEGTAVTMADYGAEAREQAFLDVQTALLDALLETAGQKAGVAYSLDTDALRGGMETSIERAVKTIQTMDQKNIFDLSSAELRSVAPLATRLYRELETKSPFFQAWFGNWRANDTAPVSIARANDSTPYKAGKSINKDTGKTVSWGQQLKGETGIKYGKESDVFGFLDSIGSIVENAILLNSETSQKNKARKMDGTAFMHKFYALVENKEGNVSLVRMTAEEVINPTDGSGFTRAYELNEIKEVARLRMSVHSKTGGLTQEASTYKHSVATLHDLVKRYDKNYKPGRKVIPELLNEDGTPKVFYHGTDAKFTVFDRTKGRSTMDIQGSFFSPYEIDAGGYGPNVGRYYLSISNPASEDVAFKALNRFKGQNNAGVKAREYLEKLGYDGVVGYDEVIAFEPAQIKSATDNIGTFDRSNPDVRYSIDTDYLRLAEKYKSGTASEAETEQLQRAVEQAAREAGYSDKMYHGSRKGGGFTVFKGWQYFTPNETYAKRYAQRNNPNSMYSVFVKADNYFDTRKAAAKRLFEKYRQEYGLGELQENGLPDWTDGYDLAEIIEDNGLKYDGIILDEGGDMVDGKPVSRGLSYVIRDSAQIKSADPVTYDDKGNIIPLSERFNPDKQDIRWSIDTDALRENVQAFTQITTEALGKGLEQLKNVTPGKGLWALKDISRFLDTVSGGDKELRDTLTQVFENPHRQALKNYADGVARMQRKVLDIGARAGVCDEKGKHFDSKKSAAIQNIGEGFSNTYTDLRVRIKDADTVTVSGYDPGTGRLVVSERDYTLPELRRAFGRDNADAVWSKVFDEAQKAQETGGRFTELEYGVNTRPYTLENLQNDFRDDWQKLYGAAREFRQMYDNYITTMNQMLAELYPYASKYADVDKITAAIEEKEARLKTRQEAERARIDELNKRIGAKEADMAGKRRKDTKAYRQLWEQKERLRRQAEEAKADLEEYEANVRDELIVMNEEKAKMQNAEKEGDSLSRMHRLEYREDYFHHFREMASGVQNLKAIFTNSTDISPAVVGKSAETKPKSRFAGFFQKRAGADYTADALNGMLRYGQLAEYKLAFDPFAAYLRDAAEKIKALDKNETNRNNLIRYLRQWTNAILGKSHDIDRALVDSGVGMRSKVFKALDWINSRVIQNTLLWNMRSALIQISNVTNAKGIVTNNLDWLNGVKSWALAARGNAEMQAIMNQSTFLASRYMDNLQLTDSVFKSAKQFAGWMLGALDEISAKATWWAAYTQYQRNPSAKVIQNAYRSYADAIEYADDVTRRTHAGRGVGELAPAMTSRVINFVAPFQVEVNNTYALLKDNLKQRNYWGLLSTGLSVFLLNTIFESIVGATPLGFDFIRAIVDICFGFADDDEDYDATRAAQRLAGEFVGGLPYASQIVGAVGQDIAKKIVGEDTDVTRYGNTQIGVNAIMNTLSGLSDIGSTIKDGRNLITETNFISDIDDLLNLIMPMGGKQLSRTAEGLVTVAKGYGSKVDKEGEEKVQFIVDQDPVRYIHAGLFGKWALTEASEYFGEERLLPRLFGAYEGPKSSMGQPVNAKEYKAALETGIDGKQFFSLKYDLKEYTTQPGKRAEMMEQDFTPEQKAKLDALLIPSSTAEVKAEGAIVYQKDSDGEWKVKADYTNRDMFGLSQNGDKTYTGTLAAMEKTGLPQDQAVLAASMWEQAKAADDSKAEFRSLLKDNNNLTVAQKEALDLQYCGNKYAADYSDPDLFELSITNRTTYEKAKQAKAQGIPVKNYVSLLDKKNEYSGEDKADYMRREIMKGNLTEKQKELLDDLLVSDKGRNPDYSSPAWFEISMLGGGQYQEAKEGAKIGLKPETYLTIYNKWKTLDAKDENGKTVNGLKKKRAKEYMDSLSISAPEYDYVWTVVFGYKTK